MKKIRLVISLILSTVYCFGITAPKTIEVHYFEQKPFFYKEGTGYSGIEYEILMAFSNWAKQKKNQEFKFNFTPYTSFDVFFGKIVKGQPNDIGMGTVTINDERKKYVEFSAPYLNNISLLISDGSVKTLNKLEDISENFKGMSGITIKGSTHEQYLNKLIKDLIPSAQINHVENPLEIPQKITENPKLFGYVDIITYWSFIKSSNHFIKIHRIANRDHENLGFIFPKNSEILNLFNEFFETGFGFTATKQYREILEKHLGHEVLTTVEIN